MYISITDNSPVIIKTITLQFESSRDELKLQLFSLLPFTVPDQRYYCQQKKFAIKFQGELHREFAAHCTLTGSENNVLTFILLFH